MTINLEGIDTAALGALAPLDLALFWASRGCPVGPADPNTKKPWMGGDWQRKATTDEPTIRAMFASKPNARVGIKTGLACGCGCQDGPDVIDFDTGLDDSVKLNKPGIGQRRKLVDAGILDGTKAMRVQTPTTTETGRGEHWWFAGTDQANKQNVDSVWGVDLRAHHGWVLAPGNPNYEIRNLPWDGLGKVAWEDIAACPGLAQKPRATAAPTAPPATQPPQPPTAMPPAPARPAPAIGSAEYRSSRLVAPVRAFDDPIGEESPLDWYTRNHDMAELLANAGWKFAYDHQGKLHYVRPGKEMRDGVSGNIAKMPDGRWVFYNFSSSVDLPVNTALSTAQLYAWLHWGGSESRAAEYIRKSMMPSRTSVDIREAGAALAEAAATAPVPPPANEQPPAPASMPPEPAQPSGGALVRMNAVFWDERPELRNIRWLARERRVSPLAMLGATLALVSCRVGPHVVLPPIVGGVASLNLLVGLVGPSGKGKGAAWAVAEEYLDVKGKFMTEEVGTSQGIDSSFTEPTPKGGPVQYNDVAFFYVPEIDSVKAHAEMSGSALLPTLRKIWSGEALGAKYAAKDRRRPVRAHAYRASVVAGIQPKRSGVLLDDVDGGTPQRWLWLPVHDPEALRRKDKLQPPAYSGQPPAIDFDVWVPLGEQRGEKDEPEAVEAKTRYEIPVCRTARETIIDAREENLVSDRASMDSHALLTRLKVAALLGFLDRRAEVSEDDWRLAGYLMKMSDATRDDCQRALQEAEEEEHARRGHNRAVQQAAEDIGRVTLKDKRAERIHELGLKLLGMLQANPGREYTPRELRLAMGDAKTGRDYGADVIQALVAVPGVVQGPEISSGGRKIRKLAWTPSNSLA